MKKQAIGTALPVNCLGYRYHRPKLTPRQIAALSAVRDCKLKKHTKRVGWQIFEVFICEGVDITMQLKALRKRKLIKNDWFDAARTQRTYCLTPGGAAALHMIGG